MAEIQQVHGHLMGRLAVVGFHHGATPRIEGGRDAHIGRAGGVQRIQDRQVVAGRRDQEEAVDGDAGHQPVDLGPHVGGGQVHRLDQQVVAGRVAGPQGAELGIAVVRDAGVGDQVADHIGARPGQAARRQPGPIAQLLGGLFHPLANFGAHAGLGVQHARHRLHRDAGPPGDIGDGDGAHADAISQSGSVSWHASKVLTMQS